MGTVSLVRDGQSRARTTFVGGMYGSSVGIEGDSVVLAVADGESGVVVVEETVEHEASPSANASLRIKCQ